MQGEPNQPQPVRRPSQPVITKFLESPAIESALPIKRVGDEVREALLAGRPAPLSAMAIQVQPQAPVQQIASGVTDQLLQRVADQDVATLLKSNARVIPIRAAAKAMGLDDNAPAENPDQDDAAGSPPPTIAEPATEPVALEAIRVEPTDPDPIDTQTVDTCETDTVSEAPPAAWAGSGADRARPREMGTIFSRWRRGRLAHASI